MQSSAALKAPFCLQVCDPCHHKVLHENLQCSSSRKPTEFWPSWISSCQPPQCNSWLVPKLCPSVNPVLCCLQGRSPLGSTWQTAQGGFCCCSPFLCHPPTCLPLALHQTLLLLPSLSYSLGFISLPAEEGGSSLPKVPLFNLPWQVSPFQMCS